MNNVQLGKWGEDFAAKVLEGEGCRIIERNFRCKAGEIDLIAEKEGKFLFVEVKTRRNLRFGRPAEAVAAAKQSRIRQAASCFLQARGGEDTCRCSFHVIEVLYHHIEDAF